MRENIKRLTLRLDAREYAHLKRLAQVSADPAAHFGHRAAPPSPGRIRGAPAGTVCNRK